MLTKDTSTRTHLHSVLVLTSPPGKETSNFILNLCLFILFDTPVVSLTLNRTRHLVLKGKMTILGEYTECSIWTEPVTWFWKARWPYLGNILSAVYEQNPSLGFERQDDHNLGNILSAVYEQNPSLGFERQDDHNLGNILSAVYEQNPSLGFERQDDHNLGNILSAVYEQNPSLGFERQDDHTWGMPSFYYWYLYVSDVWCHCGREQMM